MYILHIMYMYYLDFFCVLELKIDIKLLGIMLCNKKEIFSFTKK